MFADNTNLFYSGKDIHSLFNTVKNGLLNISYWFNSKKLSLNADKHKFTFFHFTYIKNKQYPYKVSKLYQAFRSLTGRKANMNKSYKSY